MKKTIILTGLLLMVFHFDGYAQEHYGKTLNMGVGVAGYSGFYRYAGRTIPVFNINYEIDVVKNLTLAPFASIYAFKDDYYWGDNNNPARYYTYTEVVVPIGIKSYYYFDDLINATSDWDIYAGASVGFAIVSSTWEAGYLGDRNHFNNGSTVFLDIHVGATYHFNERMGAYLDLSSGVSTIGLHFNGK